jgi:predicted short-subunit dehydrogenase-like oxidoreductase (DUF2520 family)
VTGLTGSQLDLRLLSVGIIGVGRVGSALGKALLRNGYQVCLVSARSDHSRELAARDMPEADICEPSRVAGEVDLLLVTVPDDRIGPVVEELAVGRRFHSGQFVVHTSGAHGLRVLLPARAAGAVGLAVHPAMTFPGQKDDFDKFAGLPFAITSEPAHRRAAEQLVGSLGGVPIWVEEHHRVLYHAALALAANNLTTLVASAMEVLQAAGVEDPGLLLRPLLGAALENVLRSGDQALTGPVRRADVGTIAGHLATMRESTPHLVPLYSQLARATALRARKSGLTTADQLDRVIRLLDDKP